MIGQQKSPARKENKAFDANRNWYLQDTYIQWHKLELVHEWRAILPKTQT